MEHSQIYVSRDMHEMKEKRKIITIEDAGEKDNLGCECDKAANTCFT